MMQANDTCVTITLPEAEDGQVAWIIWAEHPGARCIYGDTFIAYSGYVRLGYFPVEPKETRHDSPKAR